MRRAFAIVLLVFVVAGAKPALAQPTPTPAAPPITAQQVPSGCVGHSIGEPECGVKPQHSGDRGGWAQELLFLLVVAAMGVIFFVIVRSTRARGRATSQL